MYILSIGNRRRLLELCQNLITALLSWILQFTKNMMKQNSIIGDHTKMEANIKYRQNIIENKLQPATNKLYHHMQQSPPYSLGWNMQNETNREQHLMTILYDALTVLIRNGLHYFLMNFHQKKILLNTDVCDVQWLEPLYDLNPSEKQVSVYFYCYIYSHFYYFIF
jgi:hypothetical protein